MNAARVLILDEATSAIDPVTLSLILNNIRQRRPELTLILVTHRLNETLSHCDRILAMDDGSVVEAGTHWELLQKNGLYANLWGSARHCA